MENEPRENNPYLGLTDDELYTIIKGVQLEQRGLDDKIYLIELALIKNYSERLGR